MERTFTTEEANAALAELGPVAERMTEHRRRLAAAQIRQAELVARIAGNGGDLDSSELGEAARAVAREAGGVAECVRRLNDAGVQVKDLDRGLLDFPSRRGEEDVLLCWQIGEHEIGYWHGRDEGFAGRKPLPL